ncbi:TetR/AcrR family transcriptional regulator [Streptomyces sp. NBC_00669]|uniref:TetR/AcrR family transcriptional regulator n=1 Tax=Streptomyces sp. NBC_00669 TaxID=2976011 RepID=UPI002E2FE41B|nr:TetR/AcrR family transcriptional regulator [Streptomyces sp. NBC_00669]
MAEAVTSLRERSKAKRRAAIQRAALRLFTERGYEGATIADIAEAAEVAPRTVRMYFPNKIDIATSAADDIATHVTAVFKAHPDLSFSEAIDRWMLAEADTTDPELAQLVAAMYDANPTLQAVSGTHSAAASQSGEPALLAELGLAPDDPLLPVVTAAISSAIGEYVTTALKNGVPHEPHQRFMRYLRRMISAARDG